MNSYEKILWTIKSTQRADFDLILSAKDINHTKRIYTSKKILPESASTVTAAFVIDRNPSCRFIIKELDLLLKKNGEFRIIYTSMKNKSKHAIGVRSKMQIMHEFSVATGGRYTLVSNKKSKNFSILSYQKKCTTLKKNDSIDRWSFGIITNGQNNDSVKSLVQSIINQNIPNFEVNICGPNPFEDEIPDYINIAQDVSILPDLRGPISAKKNILINLSKFENLCLLHDRYLLHENWYSKMKEYGNYFDFLEIPNKKVSLFRAPDHQIFKGNISDTYLRGNPFLSYTRSSPNQFLQGGSITGKKSIMIKNLFLDHLHWGEFEDVHFSKKHYLDGSLIYIDIKNYFITDSERFKDLTTKTSFFYNLVFSLKNVIYWIWIILVHKYNSYKKNLY